MQNNDYREQLLRDEFLDKIISLGADCAGAASVDALRNGPSESLFPVMKDHARDHFADKVTTGLPHGTVFWESDAKSVIVFGVSHPAEKPELDWWCGDKSPLGNKQLLRISKAFIRYVKEKYPDIHVYDKLYHVERGGLYLKDAAVMAGLGCIGRNNLLVTPQFGPRVRLRAVVLSESLMQTGPIDFDPCADCDAPCIRYCPQNAFAEKIYTPEETKIMQLPGRDGSFYRASCNTQMQLDEKKAETGIMPELSAEPGKITKYCRCCELMCTWPPKKE